jgi:tetratricopeptide (TPR) repeat protein
MKRDIEVLLKGIQDEPDNERYVFYLAQSYRDDGDNLNAIKYYKKRFEMKRWYEEAWFSAFQVGVCYRRLGNIFKFEYWMQKAHIFYPLRAEPLYYLTEHFRKTGQLFKAYEYCKFGLSSHFSKEDVLFVEKFPHNGGFLYEKSILDYYIHSDKKIGLIDSMNYLLKNGEFMQNVISNLKFYTSPILCSIQTIEQREYTEQPFYLQYYSNKQIPLLTTAHCSTIKDNASTIPIYFYENPNELYSCFIKLKNDIPNQITIPFVFKSLSKEKCISLKFDNNIIICEVVNETETYHASIDSANLHWIDIV